jgi:arogenate/prephenate dehydratase
MARMKAAFQGERGAFSELAARNFLKDGFTPIPCETFEAVYDAVEKGRAERGVIPIENSLVGSIHRNYDLLLERKLHVIGETQVRIVHCLLANRGVPMAQINQAISHPVALDQCRRFFKQHPKIRPETFYDTAGAAKHVAENEPEKTAAIAGPFAAELYGLRILKRSIEDEKNNYTRFLLVAKKPHPFKGKAKTSIVFSAKNQPGILYKALSVFALRDIDLTKIESRPVRHRVWEYHFYIDLIGNTRDEHVNCALDHLAEIAHFVRVLGCYPLKVRS